MKTIAMVDWPCPLIVIIFAGGGLAAGTRESPIPRIAHATLPYT